MIHFMQKKPLKVLLQNWVSPNSSSDLLISSMAEHLAKRFESFVQYIVFGFARPFNCNQNVCLLCSATCLVTFPAGYWWNRYWWKGSRMAFVLARSQSNCRNWIWLDWDSIRHITIVWFRVADPQIGDPLRQFASQAALVENFPQKDLIEELVTYKPVK